MAKLKQLVAQYVLALEDKTSVRIPDAHSGVCEMKTYEAYVRTMPDGIIVRTIIHAENSQAAYFLLQGQYGQNNVVHLPREV